MRPSLSLTFSMAFVAAAATLAVALPAEAAPVATPAPQYTLTVLGTFGAGNSIARAISEDGKVSGIAFDWQTFDLGTVNVNNRAFLFNGVSGQLLAGVSGRTDSSANGVNSAGQVVGVVYDLADAGQGFPSQVATSRLATAFNVGSSTTLGGPRSLANAINENGTVVGQARFGTLNHAARFSGGSVVDLGTLPGGSTSAAAAVNESGVAAGFSTDSSLRQTAVVFSAGQVIDVGLSAIASSSDARGINDQGDIVGWMVANGQDATTAFVKRGGVITNLGTLGGLDYARATDINNQGWIVGQAITSDQWWNIPFLRIDGALIDLNTLVTPASKGDWLVSEALAINDRGQIAGAVFKDGHFAAALLTPVPEPTPALLLAAGLAVLSLRARRQPASASSR